MKLFTLLSFFIACTTLFGQNTGTTTTTPSTTIQVAVEEPVEVYVEKLIIAITLGSPEQQLSHIEEKYWREKYDSEDVDGKSPDEIIEEMKNAIKVKYVQNMFEDLKAANVPTRLKIGFGDLHDYYSASVVDSALYISVTNMDQMESLNSIINKYPCEVDVEETIYESVNKYDQDTYPKMVEQATEKAKILAKAMGKKVLSIQDCTNVFPLAANPRVYEGLSNFNFSFRKSYIANPFEVSDTKYSSLIFTFTVE